MVRVSPKAPIPNPLEVLDRLEGDTFKIDPVPYNKCPIGLLLIDRKSRFRLLELLPNRTGQVVSKALKRLFKGFKVQYNRYPKHFHFDGGTEVTMEFTEWLKEKGISFSISSPYTPEQNGLIERSIRVLIDRLRTTMISSRLPLYLWCFVIPYILEVVNKAAISNREKTPYQEFLDNLEPSVEHIPDASKYKVIGSSCEVLIPFEKRVKSQKLQPRTESGYLLAVIGSNTYLVYIPKRHVVIKSSFVTVIENLTLESHIPEGGTRPLEGPRVIEGPSPHKEPIEDLQRP
jgi:histone deacetylase 1/2